MFGIDHCSLRALTSVVSSYGPDGHPLSRSESLFDLTDTQYWVMTISAGSSIVYACFMLWWFAQGFGVYSRFFNIVCECGPHITAGSRH